MHRHTQRKHLLPVAACIGLGLAGITVAHAASTSRPDGSTEGLAGHPGCAEIDARACLALALQAMGGRDRLAGIHSEQLDVIGHTTVTEQSYRQAPFLSSYERDRITLDFDKQRMLEHRHAVWPESDPHQADIDSVMVVSPNGGVYRTKQGDMPCGLSSLDDARAIFALGPERLLLTAAAATDLHYAPAEWLRSTPHSVLEFRWNGQPVRVLLNAFNHLPDAVERTTTLHDFWFVWGDVQQRIYYDNWKLLHGMVLPSNRIVQRNGVPWQSMQILDDSINTPLDEKSFAMDAKVAAKSLQSKGWKRSFSDQHRVELAPGIELYRGAWNATLIKQDDGVLVLEAPISATYAQGVFAKARSELPGLPIKGVLSTSDSWPHVAGVREAVAEGLPVYVLDLNRPLLDRLVSAPHRLDPDRLQTTPKTAHWNIVAGKVEIGHGPNRVVLYPLRGASTGRQYMVYFPQRHLLYASDTLAFNPDHSLYDPELMHEVMQAVAREHLQVDTVFAMHEGPTSWSEVSKRMQTALQ